MYSHYPRHQVCVDSLSVVGGAGGGGGGGVSAAGATCRSSPHALITYEVVDAQQDDVIRMVTGGQHHHLHRSTCSSSVSPLLEDSVDSTDSMPTADATQTPPPPQQRVSPQQRRAAAALRTRTRKSSARQAVLDEEEMLKIPSPEMLNNMMRGVELNGEFGCAKYCTGFILSARRFSQDHWYRLVFAVDRYQWLSFGRLFKYKFCLEVLYFSGSINV